MNAPRKLTAILAADVAGLNGPAQSRAAGVISMAARAEVLRMRRREFIALLGSALVAMPRDIRAQQSANPTIGFLSSTSPLGYEMAVAGFRAGLKEAGYVEGQNVNIDFRWSEGRYNRLPALAADLVRSQVAVIAAIGGNNTIEAAKAATRTIPIVFLSGADPVKLGFVDTLHRPGGNITGVTVLASVLVGKRFKLLHELVPNATTIAFLVNPDNLNAEPDTASVQTAARAVAQELLLLRVTAENEFEAAFVKLVEQKPAALIVSADGFFTSRRERLVALAARHGIPAIYPWPEYAEAGGLVSYGTSLAYAYRQVGNYAGRILKGAKPADLPVEQSTKVELIINLKTAKALGLTVPLPLLGRADEVIE
jgi:putative ABC transport system substrate-binding protein